MMLKHVQKWHESLGNDFDKRLLALGTDMDGRSRLISRFMHPQKPPEHINPADPFAIEKAARYVSLIPYLQDDEMFPGLTDLWCTDQEFLNILCGDWEEHCILLCNYFNYIDRYRKEQHPDYSSADIQSYCVLCTLLPEGEAMMVLRQDRHSGDCEFWHGISGKCFFLPSPSSQRSGWFSLCRCPHRRGEDEEDEAVPEAPQPRQRMASVMKASPSIPIRRVYMAFNAENVWANLQSQNTASHKGVSALSWDLHDKGKWKPLFPHGRAELRRLSGLLPEASSSYQGVAEDWAASYRLEDPSLALIYEPTDQKKATRLEGRFESQLEQDIMNHRAMGEQGRAQQATRFNHVIADRLGKLLESLEDLAGCSRQGSGTESVFPLRSRQLPPVTLEAVEAAMHEIESDFRMVGRRGRTVFGLPFNQPYTEFRRIWEAVRDSRILDLGGEQAEYAVKVRVFPYASGVLSVWVFVAAAVDED